MKAEGARDEGAESSDKEDVLTDRGHGAEGGEHMRAHRGLAAVAGPDAGAGAVRRCSPGARGRQTRRWFAAQTPAACRRERQGVRAEAGRR